MALLKQSTAYTRMFMMIDSSDHITGKTGLTVTLTLSKAGGSFAAAGGAITEVANGWYKVALTTTDTNTLGELAFHATGSAADPTDFSDQVVSFDTQDAVRMGLTSLPNAAAEAAGGLITRGTSTGQLSVSSGNAAIQSPVKKNTALSAFEFVMRDSTGTLKTGLTVSAQRSIDGAAFGASTNSPAEVANGFYKIDLSAADLNGNVIGLRLTATGAVDTVITVLTTP